MHNTHHHCPSPTNSISPDVTACIAGASVARNKRTEEMSASCNPWCSFCGYLRYLLVFLGLLGIAIEYVVRSNISVAIVAMVNSTDTKDVNSTHACPAAFNATRDAQSTTGAGEYNWSAREQGIVLGIFFWGYVITKAIGGRIAEILGPTFTVTVAVSLCGVLTLLTPTAAAIHPLVLAALRLFMGLLQGPIFPAMYSIISRWSMPGERATMITVTLTGSGVGALVSLGLSGRVIDSFGWRWVFWGSGILTLAWVPFWVIYVRDNPRQHPGISSRELRRLSGNHNHPRKKVPWSRILKSRQIYLYIMMEFVTGWSQGVIATEGPTFLTTQIGMDLKTQGNFNLALTGVAWSLVTFYGWLSDLLERRKCLAVVNIRRLGQGIAMVIAVSSSIGLMVVGCNTTLVIVYFIMQTTGIPVGYTGYVMGPMDIAPNYAGTLSGLTGLGTIAGFLSPLFASYFMDKKNGWLIIFLVSGSMYGVASILYMIGVSATEEEWNMYEEIQDSDESTTERKEEKTDMI